MKPVKNLAGVGHWLLRIALLTIVYKFYFNFAIKFSFNGLQYFTALAFVVFAILLLLGAFMKNQGLTVVSGLVISMLSFVLMFYYGITLHSTISNIPLAALGFYFMTKGNKG
jgi:predicted neutral ceramidase superfamily lipid hydrolase